MAGTQGYHNLHSCFGAAQFADKFYYLLGYETIEASGSDYVADRDRNDVVEDFTLFETELSERIFGMGCVMNLTTKTICKFYGKIIAGVIQYWEQKITASIECQ